MRVLKIGYNPDLPFGFYTLDNRRLAIWRMLRLMKPEEQFRTVNVEIVDP